MKSNHDSSKRDFMKTALGVGGVAAAAGLASGVAPVREAYGQILESGIDPNSVLANVKKEGKLRVGYSQTTGVWVGKSAKTGKLEGCYIDAVELLCNSIKVEPEYTETTFGNATIGLRARDFDVAASSYIYSMPRSLVVDFVGPLWRKGWLAAGHKDLASRFKTQADFNSPEVTFAVDGGSVEETVVKARWPKAKIFATTGGVAMRTIPIKAKQADLFIIGSVEMMVFGFKNDWAHIVDPDHPIDMSPNTWMIRYGDPDWKRFLDFWANYIVNNGFMKERVDFHSRLV
jgi:polar amino acid transport system substrate-binding protein